MNTKMSRKLVLFCAMTIAMPLVANADSWFSSRSGVAPVTNKLYAEECSACHYAYQPGLLPARSWKKMLTNLADHFGENAELSEDETLELLEYATKNSADNSNRKRSVKITRSINKQDTPLRITDVAYIKRKHRELSARHVAENPRVKMLSRCEACHTKINKGSFSEREINIPHFGPWED